MVSKYRFLVLLAVALVAIGAIGASTTFAATSKPLPQAESETGASDGGGTNEEMTVEYDDGSGYIPPSGEQSPPPTGGGDGGGTRVDDPTGNEEENPFSEGCKKEKNNKSKASALYNIEGDNYNSTYSKYLELTAQIENLEYALANPGKNGYYVKTPKNGTVTAARLNILKKKLSRFEEQLQAQEEELSEAYADLAYANRVLIACLNA